MNRFQVALNVLEENANSGCVANIREHRAALTLIQILVDKEVPEKPIEDDHNNITCSNCGYNLGVGDGFYLERCGSASCGKVALRKGGNS